MSSSCPRTRRLDPGRRRRRAAGEAARPRRRRRTCRRCATWSASSSGRATWPRTDDGLRLTPRAVRRLGQTALKRVFAQLEASGRGDHDDHRTGSADERTGADPAVGVRRRAAAGRAPHGRQRARVAAGLPRTGRRRCRWLAVEDFEVVETERRTTAAVALCVDLSFSMVQDGRWGPMKQTALALNHLIETRFRQDALQVIGFNRYARRLTPLQLAEVEPEWIQGTNLQHALMLAARHLRRHPDAEPVVLVVTDGEPTAHLAEDGEAQFQWPTTSRDAARDRGAGRRADPLRRHAEHLHARRGPGPGPVRRRHRPAQRWAGVHPRHRPAGGVRRGDYLRPAGAGGDRRGDLRAKARWSWSAPGWPASPVPAPCGRPAAEVVLIDRGRRIGGRMASRRVDGPGRGPGGLLPDRLRPGLRGGRWTTGSSARPGPALDRHLRSGR